MASKPRAFPLANESEIVTHEQPFGPVAAGNISDEAFREYFDTDNSIYKEMSNQPGLSLIIGRRGSGKTAFLRSAHIDDEFQLVIKLPPEKAFRQIVESIESVGDQVVLVEEVEELWNIVLWATVMARVPRFKEGTSDPRHEIVRRYFKAIQINPRSTPYLVMRRMIDEVRKHCGREPLGALEDFVNHAMFDGIDFSTAKENAIDYLKVHGVRAIVLLDSLDDFQLEYDSMQHALAGLLKCQANFNEPGSPCVLRCCIPAELYPALIDGISTNPNKDFQNILLMQWSAEELLHMAAHRFRRYVMIHEPQLYREQFQDLKMRRRQDLLSVWRMILPQTVLNHRNSEEDGLAYLLRHTQLLPRHLLLYLNRIAAKSRRMRSEGRGDNFPRLSETAIREGIAEVEGTICSEILSAYRYVYPGAANALKRCLPELPICFTDPELKRVYNRRGKNRVSGISEYDEFREMLFNMGIVGRAIDGTSRYIIGQFAYNLPHQLVASHDDRFCVHPVFARRYSMRPDDKGQFVYPHGCEIEDWSPKKPR